MCLGIPGRVVAIDAGDVMPTGTVDFDGIRKEVCLAFTPEAVVGDYVIVHVGFAISRVDEAEALRTLDVLRAMGDAVATELGESVHPRRPPHGVMGDAVATELGESLHPRRPPHGVVGDAMATELGETAP